MKQKIKIMKQKPVLSDEEIKSYMNFDHLIDNQSVVSKRMFVTKLTTVALLVLLSGVGALYLYTGWQNARMETSKAIDEVPIPEISSSALAVDSITSASSEGTPVVPGSGTTGRINSQKSNRDSVAKSDKSKSEIPLINSLPEDLYVQAEPLEGYADLYEYFSDNLKYPTASVGDSIQGVETVSFTINAAGKPEAIFIRKSLGGAFDEESIRLIQNMPAWKPATLKGKPVASQMSIPLTFKLEKLK